MTTAADPSSQDPRSLVLLGAGHAHVQVLAQLARKPLPGVQVTLVSPHPHLFHFPMVAGYVAGRYDLDACNIAIEPLVRASAVRWLRRNAVALDANRRLLRLDDGTDINYQWLSVNIGGVQDRDRVELNLPGAREHGLFVRPFNALGALWPKVVEMATSRTLRVAIVGGGDTAVELAMAIRHRLPQAALTLVSGLTGIAIQQPTAMQGILAQALKQRRINVVPDRATRLSEAELTLASGARLACDVALIATGVSAPGWLQASGLACDADGFMTVDACQRSCSHANVFGAGDVSTRADSLLPRNGRAALSVGPTLAANLAAITAGQSSTACLARSGALKLLGYGDGRGLAAWGGHALQGRMAWWYKDWIDRSFVRRLRESAPPAS
ncbi:MAG: FAD-dependent oxidoreductase [Rhodoferax sp.]|nr:FAD-dependent oxidoreductase [Rhodoferax sp.]MBK9237936.1 FAD-dependent oxidoreductase [Rhodoferax sp.]